MVETPPYEIVESSRGYGPTLRINAPWSPEAAAMSDSASIQSFSIGPRVRDLSFLRGRTDVVALSFVHEGADLAPIYSLENLRFIYMANVSGPKIDFKAFPLLEEASLEWTNALSSVFEAKGLRRLFIGNLPKAKVPLLEKLAGLEILTLLGCATSSLDPLRKLTGLRSLRIGLFRKLEDNDFLASLTHLRELNVQDCAGFSKLDPLSGLEKLERIALEDVGALESLHPLHDLTELRSFVFFGGPKNRLVDGDLSPVWFLPNLERFYVRGKRGVDWRIPNPKPVVSHTTSR